MTSEVEKNIFWFGPRGKKQFFFWIFHQKIYLKTELKFSCEDSLWFLNNVLIAVYN